MAKRLNPSSDRIVRAAVTASIRRCKKSRDVIAAELTEKVGNTVTLRALYSYTSAAADQNRFPMQYAAAFCEVTGDYAVLKAVAKSAGGAFVPAAELRALRIGQLVLQRSNAETRLKLEGVAL